METTVTRTKVGWQGSQGVGPRDRSPERLNSRYHWLPNREGEAGRKAGAELGELSRIVTSGVTVWLAIVAGMTALL